MQSRESSFCLAVCLQTRLIVYCRVQVGSLAASLPGPQGRSSRRESAKLLCKGCSFPPRTLILLVEFGLPGESVLHESFLLLRFDRRDGHDRCLIFG